MAEIQTGALSLEANWIVNNDYPKLQSGGELISVFSIPYPSESFYCSTEANNGYPYYKSLNLLSVPIEPYPVGIFIQKNGEYPKIKYLDLIDTGAFCWAKNLSKVVIPESVKYIGITAFRNTILSDVKISMDCIYFPTSFPDGCEVNFYPYETNFITADGLEIWTAGGYLFQVKEVSE